MLERNSLHSDDGGRRVQAGPWENLEALAESENANNSIPFLFLKVGNVTGL
jgi:hypothetical protein